MKYNIEIKKKNIKNIRVSVKAGTLLVSAPKYVKEEDIYRMIEKNNDKIEKMLELEQNKLYQNSIKDNEIYLFGELINIEDAKKIKNENDLEKFYKEEFLEILPYIFEKYNKKTNLYQKEFKIRKMKARWGTCYPDRGLILLNLYLIKRPIIEIESVVLHELVHLKIRNHSKDFYEELKLYMKDYKEITRRLNS